MPKTFTCRDVGVDCDWKTMQRPRTISSSRHRGVLNSD